MLRGCEEMQQYAPKGPSPPLFIQCGRTSRRRERMPRARNARNVFGIDLAAIAAAAAGAGFSTAMASDTAHHDRTQRPPNRLARETSPYLLQHAYNPVDWHAWGEEAFASARSQDKPIFLSIGYSTCYWCHVMERESFEDEATAAVLNRDFVCIKLDREERPDVDAMYMMATQLMSGHGGWPMSVFLEPRTLKPFFAGTYFPSQPRHGMPSFTQVLEAVAQAWRTHRDEMQKQADAVARAVAQHLSSHVEPRSLDQSHITAAIGQLMHMYDRQHGGFGGAPKFPQPVFLEFLLHAARDDEFARDALLHTLDRMATGGIYDQVGGGFHRYATDGQWMVPHFEKMLYDNGQLLSVYAEAWQRTRTPLFEKVVRETAEYVLREMTGDAGGFFSAQDAEVKAREGLSYLWTLDDMREALVAAGLESDVDFALGAFGVSRGANFTDPHFPEDGPKNVLVLTEVGEGDLHRLERVQRALLAARARREQPRLDDKVLASWNGLMIAGMADAGRALGEQRWVDAAARAASFVLEHMRTEDGGLCRSWRGGQTRSRGFLEDDAFMIHGLLALERATSDNRWLREAEALARHAHGAFWDHAHGGYFETLADQPDLFVRAKQFYDGATPSGNGTMANNLIALYERTGDREHLNRAIATLRAASGQIAVGPVTCAMSALALHRLLRKGGDSIAALQRATVPTDSEAQQPIVGAELKGIKRSGAGLQLDVHLHIAPGYHINAHDPGDDRLIGLRIDATDAHGAIRQVQAAYPPGEPLGAADAGEMVLVHHGDVIVPVQANTDIAAVRVHFQACTDAACLAPQTVELSLP